jgi:hypothetical protein
MSNVATSRARQMQLANAFCQFREMARHVEKMKLPMLIGVMAIGAVAGMSRPAHAQGVAGRLGRVKTALHLEFAS